MQVGPSSRKPKSQKVYAAHRRDDNGNGCAFCLFEKNMSQVLADHDSFWLIKNIFGYDLWDDNDVLEHLMLVPKKHIVSLSELNSKESTKLMKLIAKYEQEGYSLYARAPQNITKSVVHQHTHLIKLGKTRKKFKLFVRKPHILVYK